jgi:glycosyltransferase involved in cell wall biosynthesis
VSTTSVSICLPTRDRLALLRESLAGILAQDHVPLEIVISDNWSEDGTREHCLDLAARDPRVRYVRPPEPVGLLANHNFAFARSTGRYVCFFHDDDLYRSTIVSRYAGLLDRHPSVGAVCASFERVDASGHSLGLRRQALPAIMRGLDHIDRTIASGRTALVLSGSMYRGDALRRPPFDEDGPTGYTDMVTAFRVAETYDIGYVAEPLWSYRSHAAAFSHRSAETVADHYTRAFTAYCDEFLTRHPDQAARVARWRRAIERYRFWVLLYDRAVTLATPGSSPDRALADLSQMARGPLQHLSLRAVRAIAALGWRWPLALLGRYGVTGRRLIGFR